MNCQIYIMLGNGANGHREIKRGMGRETMLECLYTKPSVVMPLYETEKEVLEHFIESVCIEEKISEEYLILYNFATDCRYAKEIQAQLLQYLVPFFLKCVREYVLKENIISRDICWEFAGLTKHIRSQICLFFLSNYTEFLEKEITYWQMIMNLLFGVV